MQTNAILEKPERDTMTRILTLLLLITTLLTGCGLASLPPPPTATATQTFTPSPTNTIIPTLVFETQEHLLITRDGVHLIMLNADGSLYKSIQMPNNESFGRPDYDVSPDGKWLAYESG